METLEQRKEKYRNHMEKAKAYESDDDLTNAFKEYRKALPFCLLKKDSDFLKKKIQDLQDKHQYINNMADSGSNSSSNKGLIIAAIGVALLVVVVIGVVVFVIKPF